MVGTGALGALLLAIRAGGSAAGWAFQLQDPRTTIVLLLLAVAITLNLLRTFELPVLAGEHNPGGSFGTGALAAFVATPCAGPFLGAALGNGAAAAALWLGRGVRGAGAGAGDPVPADCLRSGLRTRLPQPGPWMVRLQRFLAIPMAATAVGCLWLLYRQAGPAALVVGLVAVVALSLLAALDGRARSARAAPSAGLHLRSRWS